MGPTKLESERKERPRRGSLPELKSKEAEKDKKTPTGPRANPLYKTRLCMNYQSTGSCPYTEKCQFAHGAKELEKWESWRTVHKDERKDGESEPRSRSLSLETPYLQPSLDEFGSPIYGSPEFGTAQPNWELTTPVRRPVDEFRRDSTSSTFSLWSFDDIENNRPFSSNSRTRAATFDSTYDNISQLRDAPTLFASPPIIPSMSKFTYSH